MSKPLKLRAHDLQPFLYFELKNQAGVGVDLTGASYKTSMENAETFLSIIAARTTGIAFDDSANGDDILLGKGHFEWTAGDTNIAGIYNLEIEVTPAAGGKFTMGLFNIFIGRDIDNV